MKTQRQDGKEIRLQSGAAVRISISFPQAVYQTLEMIAKEKKKMSLACVVREAAEKYIADEWPVLKGQG